MNQNSLSIQVKADKPLLSKTGNTDRILEILVQAPYASGQDGRPKLNLALVLDRSGSMHGAKLEYVKKAASHVLDQLNQDDRVSLVIYDDEVQTLAPSTAVTNGNRFELKQMLYGVGSGNTTFLSGGWLTGCRNVASAARDGTINRTMLLTDGLANVGETDLEKLAIHAREIRKDSVSTSTFGVGLDFNEHLLEAMSNQGGGNFYFIDRPERIPEIFAREFDNLVGIIARNVEVKIPLAPNVKWHVLGGWPAEYKEGHLHIYLGEMISGKSQYVYVKLAFPGDEKTPELRLAARTFGKGDSGRVFDDQAEIAFAYADQKEVDAATADPEVMERFGKVDMADEATEALKLERLGEREAAERRMQESINRHRRWAPQATINSYESMSDRMRRGMTEQDRKSSHWDVYRQKQQKTEDSDQATEPDKKEEK